MRPASEKIKLQNGLFSSRKCREVDHDTFGVVIGVHRVDPEFLWWQLNFGCTVNEAAWVGLIGGLQGRLSDAGDFAHTSSKVI